MWGASAKSLCVLLIIIKTPQFLLLSHVVSTETKSVHFRPNSDYGRVFHTGLNCDWHLVCTGTTPALKVSFTI